jgi:GntR family colanic acid and biofilm gene transcriptional regulator
MLDLDHLEKAQRVSLTMQVEHSLKGALITGSQTRSTTDYERDC